MNENKYKLIPNVGDTVKMVWSNDVGHESHIYPIIGVVTQVDYVQGIDKLYVHVEDGHGVPILFSNGVGDNGKRMIFPDWVDTSRLNVLPKDE